MLQETSPSVGDSLVSAIRPHMLRMLQLSLQYMQQAARQHTCRPATAASGGTAADDLSPAHHQPGPHAAVLALAAAVSAAKAVVPVGSRPSAGKGLNNILSPGAADGLITSHTALANNSPQRARSSLLKAQSSCETQESCTQHITCSQVEGPARITSVQTWQPISPTRKGRYQRCCIHESELLVQPSLVCQPCQLCNKVASALLQVSTLVSNCR